VQLLDHLVHNLTESLLGRNKVSDLLLELLNRWKGVGKGAWGCV